MKFFVFLRSKLLYLLMSAACMGFTWALLSVLRQSAATIVSILILEALAVLLPVAVEYARKRSYYSRLLRSLDALDRKVLLCEVLDEPDFLEGRILYQTLMVCNKSMNDEIAFYRRQEEEYREYIEALDARGKNAACRGQAHVGKRPWSCSGERIRRSPQD